MAIPKNIKSGHAFIDVTVGRKALEKHFAKRPPLGPCPTEMRIPVVIHGYLDHQSSSDDGESAEFAVTVDRVEIVVENGEV
jgi:hypothetical protein